MDYISRVRAYPKLNDDIADRSDICNEARKQASTKAEDEAKQLADLANVHLGKVSSIRIVVIDYTPLPISSNAMHQLLISVLSESILSIE